MKKVCRFWWLLDKNYAHTMMKSESSIYIIPFMISYILLFEKRYLTVLSIVMHNITFLIEIKVCLILCLHTYVKFYHFVCSNVYVFIGRKLTVFYFDGTM